MQPPNETSTLKHLRGMKGSHHDVAVNQGGEPVSTAQVGRPSREPPGLKTRATPVNSCELWERTHPLTLHLTLKFPSSQSESALVDARPSSAPAHATISMNHSNDHHGPERPVGIMTGVSLWQKIEFQAASWRIRQPAPSYSPVYVGPFCSLHRGGEALLQRRAS